MEAADPDVPLISTSQCWTRYEHRFICGTQKAEKLLKIGVCKLTLLMGSVITSHMDNDFSDCGGQGAQKLQEFV